MKACTYDVVFLQWIIMLGCRSRDNVNSGSGNPPFPFEDEQKAAQASVTNTVQ